MSTENAMRVRGVRGATTSPANTREAVLEATRELLQEILKLNQIDDPEDIASILFTTTPDLTASTSTST
ncbi:MAG: chorismate mutase, partial [Planctomycetaceae bacterium]